MTNKLCFVYTKKGFAPTGRFFILSYAVTDIPPRWGVLLLIFEGYFFILLVKEVAFCALCKKTEDDQNTCSPTFGHPPDYFTNM